MLLKIIKGLCYLSEWKILHRDIKPSNILLNYDDLPKIIDFGSCAPFADIDTLLPRQKEQE